MSHKYEKKSLLVIRAKDFLLYLFISVEMAGDTVESKELSLVSETETFKTSYILSSDNLGL
jgi:hypothetical protein